MTNTVLVLGMLYLIYGQKLIDMLTVQNLQAVQAIIIATVTTSGIIEMIVSAIIAVIIAKALKKALHI
jgi:uncharacterized membrane protein